LENQTINVTTNTELSTLPPAERALIVLNTSKTEVQLREMIQETESIVDVQDGPGREQAHRAGMKLKNARTTIEKTGKAARDDATKFSKAVIDEEKRLVAIVEGEEKRVLGLRDAYDTMVANEKAAKEAAEKARKDEILKTIEGIRRLPLDLAGENSETIYIEINALKSFVPSEDAFCEFIGDANAALENAIESLTGLHAQALAREEAAAAVEADRLRIEEAKIEAQKQLQAERDALAAEKAALAAERAELEAFRAEKFKLDAASIPATQIADIVAELPTTDFVGVDMAQGPDKSVIFDQIRSMPTEFIEKLNDDDIEAEYTEVSAPVEFSEPWVREFALRTAEQFKSLATKVQACGGGSGEFDDFANELLAVAYGLSNGDHDVRIAGAEKTTLLEADSRLLDSTMSAIDLIAPIDGEVAL
jgi:hypothetical protein